MTALHHKAVIEFAKPHCGSDPSYWFGVYQTCQSAFNGDPVSSSNCDPPPRGGTGGEALPHLSREIFRVVGGDIENAPEQLGDIERSVASPADNDAPLPV